MRPENLQLPGLNGGSRRTNLFSKVTGFLGTSKRVELAVKGDLIRQAGGEAIKTLGHNSRESKKTTEVNARVTHAANEKIRSADAARSGAIKAFKDLESNESVPFQNVRLGSNGDLNITRPSDYADKLTALVAAKRISNENKEKRTDAFHKDHDPGEDHEDSAYEIGGENPGDDRCGAQTKSGTPCRNAAGSCQHHS